MFRTRFDYQTCLERTWDEIFAAQEPSIPLPHVHLVDALAAVAGAKHRLRALYIGSGNGRNYAPLLRLGFDLTAVDLSRRAIDQLNAVYPHRRHRHFCGDFRRMALSLWPLVVVIRALHEGGRAIAMRNLIEAAGMLEPGGLLALQVPAVGTTLWPGKIVERFSTGGFSLLPDGGVAYLYYFARPDLDELMAAAGLVPVRGPEIVEAPKRRAAGGVVCNWLLVARMPG